MWRNYKKLPVSIRSSSVYSVITWCALLLITIWYLHAELYTVYGPFLKLRDWGPSPTWASIVQHCSNGLGITGRRFSAWLVIIGFTVAQYILYHNQWGFPTSGAFVTAFGTSAYLWWQWYQIEPQKA